MKRLAIVLCVLSFGSAYCQAQHIRSQGQCKVDEQVWAVDTASSSAIMATEAGSLTARELLSRASEMLDCSIAYGKSGQDMYSAIANAYQFAYHTRIENFLHRHLDYWQLFLLEDTEGKR